MTQNDPAPAPATQPAEHPHRFRIASCEIQQAACQRQSDRKWRCTLNVRSREGNLESIETVGDQRDNAIAAAVSKLCLKAITIQSCRIATIDAKVTQAVVEVAEAKQHKQAGIGRCADTDPERAVIVATIRAVHHAGLLKGAYRANHQKQLRQWSKQLVDQIVDLFASDQTSPLTTKAATQLSLQQRLEAEALVLDQMNRVASAAIITAANSSRPDTILSLFDTSAWLFEADGRRRDSFTETDLWLAWYPGLANDDLTVQSVIDSMPAAPATAIPFVVRLFENPASWIRFRGAIDLDDHDVLHVLLGRGLQDQDEAFVLGFAMGTAKRVSWLQYRIFKWVLARLYPEPYRIPKYLLPAFDLGVACGKETGNKDLYKGSLHTLRDLPLAEARARAGIDVNVLRSYFRREQEAIPSTIASMRLG